MADINGDGREDLLVPGPPEPTASLTLVALLQAADGSFAAPAGVLARWCGAYGGFAVGDLNRDGRLDLLQHGDTCPQAGLLALLQTAGGQFEAAHAPLSADVGNATLADIDGDGRLDAVTLDGGALLSDRLQRSDGSFADAVNQVASARGAASPLLLASDVDGDGRADLLTREGVHLQKRVSPPSVTPGVRALGRLPVLPTGLRRQADHGGTHWRLERKAHGQGVGMASRRAAAGLRQPQRGNVLLPIRKPSTSRAACRPSRIAQTTRDWPRRMSPAANTLSTLVR